MATPAQINANRLNAQHSTGPRSVEGKNTARFNALKHAMDARSTVIPGEDPAAIEALSLEYHRQFLPANPLETFLVDSLVRADWTRRRLAILEARAVQTMLTAAQARDEFRDKTREPIALDPLGSALILDAQGPNILEKLARRQAAQDRAYFRALAELRKSQAARQSEPAPQPPASPVPSPQPPDPQNQANLSAAQPSPQAPPSPKTVAISAQKEDPALRL